MSSTYYLHGFGSRFDPTNRKITTLAKLGSVRGHNIDYMQPAEEVIEDSLDKLMQVNPDLIVGTSMGGWLAGVLGAETGIPFVAINPVVDPSRTLKPLIVEGEDLQGNPCELTAATVASYYPFVQSGGGIVLLDQGDEFIPWRETFEALDGYYPVHTFPGGNHRFTHMEESLALIREHIAQ
ncbi:MAG: YqiA/YcfP family alpha/beta fold hydrolase [Marinobacter sp.]|uniref:YqiA/YcfP family alpha/beta fold hydrolase n=1 Tax=Marinobacter sp. TaxID=50741 RepID=UPI00329A1295